MTYEQACEQHSQAKARADHAGARARESGKREDWQAYTRALEELAVALTAMDRAWTQVLAQRKAEKKAALDLILTRCITTNNA